MKILIPILFFTTLKLHADLVGGTCQSCQKSCNDVDQIALEVIEKTSTSFMKNFLLSKESANKGKQFFNENAELLNAISDARKSLSTSCLEAKCQGNKQLKYRSTDGIEVNTDNPLCESTTSNFKIISMSINNQSIGQINYRVKEQSLSILFRPATKACKDNEGGTFPTKVVLGLESITLVPDDGTTKVDNTPTGAQLIKKTKSIMHFAFNPQTNQLAFEAGADYRGKIDLTQNKITENNFLAPNCTGTVGRNPTKKTSRMILNPSSLMANGNKVIDTNQYKLIESEISKVGW